MERNKIERKVCQVISETLKMPMTPDRLRTDGFSALEVNSMTFLLLVTGVENAFDIEFDDDEINYGMFGDFDRFCELVHKRLEESE